MHIIEIIKIIVHAQKMVQNWMTVLIWEETSGETNLSIDMSSNEHEMLSMKEHTVEPLGGFPKSWC